MVLLGKNMFVEELKKDMIVDGLMQKYDDTAPYMFAKIIGASEDIRSILSIYGNLDSLVVLFRRATKIPVLSGCIVNYDDVLAVLTMEEYNNL